jgi:ribosomal protein S18 acetylase RimI-like enzyme
MHTRPLDRRDYDFIVQVIDRWWGGPTGVLAHPIFFYELGDLARVADDNGVMVGFLFGFLSRSKTSGAVGYVHLVGIHPDYRRRGVARMLYQGFEKDCREAGAETMKAIAAVGNEAVQRFHQALGWDMLEVDDYAGPGRHRVVFTKNLSNEPSGGRPAAQ